MPAFLVTIFTWALGGFVARTLLGAGLAFGSYLLIEGFVNDGLLLAVGHVSGLGDVGQLMYLAGLGDALSIVGSALVVSVSMQAARIFLVRSS